MEARFTGPSGSHTIVATDVPGSLAELADAVDDMHAAIKAFVDARAAEDSGSKKRPSDDGGADDNELAAMAIEGETDDGGKGASTDASAAPAAKRPRVFQPRRRVFRKFTYRGVDLEQLLEMKQEELIQLFTARQRRSINRGLLKKRSSRTLLKKLRKAKAETPQGEKPEPVKTHLRNMVIIPEMIGSVVGVYNGSQFNQVEIKPEMVGHFLGEFSITYRPVRHGRPGVGSSNTARFIPI
ncbi:uncharacterized protein AMSG_08375 [Thecamonas trahens ATCC 50062]|uniref:40S ribosomal protein S15 n=1 Tax=Thecamonas trahens ATCC 50062 TaxID=461836 RepID=A0A0L0DJL8_THETB|nr:hypothetical protein AMSG_08375 [Thecamonas trahens ATCC 50062]KNC52400.1 hypothetical protein AMSG_08375 [Thecamonas trahens ATCC 50062]|eukprot:XP_013755443.1 hypothetical protein AMSG_08375 [Thecamonas trahens ATCC 50062]